MAIYLRQELTSQLVRETYGGYDELAAAWEDRSVSMPGFPNAKQRSSLYRWAAAGVPTRRDGADHQYFALCGLLDVDPLVVFDFHRNGYFSRFARIRQLIYFGRTALGGLATLLDMYRPSDVWPSDAIARKCYGRPWFTQQLSNRDDWNNSSYILLKAVFRSHSHQKPRAVHIAYRRLGVPDTMWRYYGTVLSISGNLELYSESGTYREEAQVSPDEIWFRTYFGGRPVEWRIASLHEFDLETVYPSCDESFVTFTW